MGDVDEDDLTLSARLGAAIPMEDGDTTNIGLDVVLSYQLEKFRVFVPVGLGIVLNGDTLIAWNFNPYIVKDLNGPNFYAGLQLFNGGNRFNSNSQINASRINSTNSSQINWAIPMGIRWDF
jgi:hypothetical protein